MQICPYLSIIIPAYNEERRIVPTLENVVSYLKKQSWTWEIIVVSDGSTDRTEEIFKSFQKKYPSTKVLAYGKNRGKGYAVKQGMLAAGGHLRLFMDADSSTPIEEIKKLLPYVRQLENANPSAEAHEIVIGSLGVAGAQVNKRQFFFRVVGGKIGNFIIQLLIVPNVQDTQRGFKLFTAFAAEKIFSNLIVDRWGFDIEVLALARFMRLSIKEVPVNWSHSEGSKISFFSYLHVLVDLVRIRWRMWNFFKKYES